jgi:3-oxoacyl-[acyl-carrier protein] reductase
MGVFVSGATRGIGRAIVFELADSHDIAVNGRDTDRVRSVVEEIEGDEESEGTAIEAVADVRDPDAVERAVTETAETFGGLDAVVNNAGVIRPALVEDLSEEDWQAVLDTNLTGAFHVVRAATPFLRESSGDIVSISSIGGTDGTIDVGYAASKAGLHGLTRALARELGPDGVQANAIAPGPVETEMNEEIVEYLESIDFHGHENVDTHLPQYACSPATIARTVRDVLENDFMQGEVLAVNGGMGFR